MKGPGNESGFGISDKASGFGWDQGLGSRDSMASDFFLVAEWIHFALFGIILPTLNLQVYTFWGLSTQRLSVGLRAWAEYLGFWIRAWGCGLRFRVYGIRPLYYRNTAFYSSPSFPDFEVVGLGSWVQGSRDSNLG